MCDRACGAQDQSQDSQPSPLCALMVLSGWCIAGATTAVSLQENCAILKELVSLRAQKSRLLGFPTHADYVLEMNMAKTSQTVATFLGSHPAPPHPAHGLLPVPYPLILDGHYHWSLSCQSQGGPTCSVQPSMCTRSSVAPAPWMTLQTLCHVGSRGG